MFSFLLKYSEIGFFSSSKIETPQAENPFSLIP
jgi:hypothetical protein